MRLLNFTRNEIMMNIFLELLTSYWTAFNSNLHVPRCTDAATSLTRWMHIEKSALLCNITHSADHFIWKEVKWNQKFNSILIFHITHNYTPTFIKNFDDHNETLEDFIDEWDVKKISKVSRKTKQFGGVDYILNHVTKRKCGIILKRYFNCYL